MQHKVWHNRVAENNKDRRTYAFRGSVCRPLQSADCYVSLKTKFHASVGMLKPELFVEVN